MSNTLDLSPLEWVKSTHSGNGGGNCVEWSPAYAEAHGVVPVRDSKDPDGPVLMVSPEAWASFVGFARTVAL